MLNDGHGYINTTIDSTSFYLSAARYKVV